ncbi:MAG: hypothetical protein QM715_19285 [Nibricoccus sp.]
MFKRILLALPVACLLTFTSCREPKIRSYRIAKESESPAPAQTSPSPGMTVSNKPRAGLTWQKPDAWQEQTGKSMRVASFLLGEKDGVNTELAVTAFPGDVGGDFANVNRWRGQIQLPPISEAELPSAITSLDLPTGKFQLIDITSTEPLLDGKFKARILGAWLKQPDHTWFFKITGDEATVGGQRDNLLAFLRTVAFTEPASAPSTEPVNAGNMPATAGAGAPAMPPSGMMSGDVPPPPASDNPLVWTAPAGWTAKPLGQMRKGSYTVPGSAGDADLSVTMLSAKANPLLENINRWRRQIGLAPLAETDLSAQTTALAVGDLKITMIDYANNANRVLGGILYLGDEAWFFKLSGPEATVASQKPAFVEFLKSVKTR